MKKCFLGFCFILVILTASNCNNCHGWDYRETVISPNKPSNGCNRNTKVYFKNQTGKSLICFFIEFEDNKPIPPCESFVRLGVIVNFSSISRTIKKGNIGYFVFSETDSGRCTVGQRKADYFVDCSKGTNDEAYFIID